MIDAAAGTLARRLDRQGIHYGWVVAAVSFLTLITAAGFRSTIGVLIVPLQDEFGWSRATISAAVAINLILYGLGGPFAAGFYNRFGIRRVIVIALLSIAGSSLLTTQIDAAWQLDVLLGAANGLATGAIGVTLAAVIANRWFVKRRGVVVGMHSRPVRRGRDVVRIDARRQDRTCRSCLHRRSRRTTTSGACRGASRARRGKRARLAHSTAVGGG